VDLAQWSSVLMVFARVSAFMAVGPLFSLRHVPPLVKAGAGLLAAALIAPLVRVVPAERLEEFVLVILTEVLVGLALGYAATLAFQAIRVAGQLVDLETGLAMADLLDPETGAGITVLGEFFYLLGILVLLQLDGHHGFLRALADSFETVPPGVAAWHGGLAQEMAKRFSAMFALAFRLAAPMVAVLVVSDVALALVARTVPQLNVFMLGFPLKAGLALVVLVLIMPLLAAAFGPAFRLMDQNLALVTYYLAGR
jgi:flagellar biosynthetic protein FliR